ncbi:MAG: FGGY family carbohydrate kinase [Lentisphaeria bacterium]|nr:FGGY family carbohydrate kinase [Lentisphaeria bacterium]
MTLKPICLLALDIGTTAVKAALFDVRGKLLGLGADEYSLETPRPDFVELEVEQYWKSTQIALQKALQQAGVAPAQILGLSVTGQAETLILLDQQGVPLRKAIVWLDNRAVDQAKEIEEHFGLTELFRMSGQNEMLPCWPAAKLLWIRQHEPELFVRVGSIMMVEDYIVYRLSGERATCRALLPSTLYYDLERKDYSSEMLKYLGISRSQLPALKDSGEAVACCHGQDGILPAGAKIAAAPLDQICGNLGCGAAQPGLLSETTGCALALCAPFDHLVYDPERRVSTYLGAKPDSFVLMPWAPNAGMLLKYFRDEFAGGLSYKELDAEAALVPPGCDGLLLLPHLSGSVSPVANSKATGVAYGVTLQHKRAHWARAVLESVAFLLRDNLELLRECGASFQELRSLGGASGSRLWLQIKADVLQLPVILPECSEATALGAAMLAALAAGEYATVDQAVCHMVRSAGTLRPGPDAEAYQQYFQRYRKLNQLIMPTYGEI